MRGELICGLCSADACSVESCGEASLLSVALLRVRICFVALAVGSILKIVFFKALAFIALSISKHAVIERLQTHRKVSHNVQVVKAINLHNALNKCETLTLCTYLTAR